MKLISMNSNEYRNIHDWIRRRLNHVNNCSFCGKNSSETKLDNALLIGKEHDRNIDNYIKLCRKCHYNYDHPNGMAHDDKAKIKIGLSSSERVKINGVHPNFINARNGKKLSEETKLKMSIKAKQRWIDFRKNK